MTVRFSDGRVVPGWDEALGFMVSEACLGDDEVSWWLFGFV